MIATILLHDVAEDCNVDIDTMPFNNRIKTGVRCMTVQKIGDNEDKIITKRRYFNELLNSKEALVCKALDRYNKLSDTPFGMTAE